MENLIVPEYARQFLGEGVLLALINYEMGSESSEEEDESFLARHLVPAASAAIRRYTGRTFTASNYTEFFDLNQWSIFLVLRHFPVASVAKVTLHPHDRSAIEEINGTEYVVSAAGELRLRPDSTASSLFPPGFQSVKVQYTAGGDVPADVQWACGRLVSAMVSAMGREPGLVLEKIDGHVRDWSDTAYTTIAANPELRAVLDPLRNGRVI